jgi:hypothetical protein
LILCEAWLTLLGTAGAKEVLAQLALNKSHSVKKLIQIAFPFASLAPASRINRLAEMADQIGLSSAGVPASWLADVLSKSWLQLQSP